MTEKVTKAIQEYREQLKKDYAPNGAVALKDVFMYDIFDTIIDIIEDVNKKLFRWWRRRRLPSAW